MRTKSKAKDIATREDVMQHLLGNLSKILDLIQDSVSVIQAADIERQRDATGICPISKAQCAHSYIYCSACRDLQTWREEQIKNQQHTGDDNVEG